MSNYSKVTERKTDRGYAYWVEGDEKKKPLILISGFTGTHGDLLSLAHLLKEKYFVIIPEFPGWGDSPKGTSSFTIISYAKFIGHLVEELHIKEATIIAHCMGATVALEAAHLFPKKIKELILISTPYQVGTPGDIFFKELAQFAQKVPFFLRPLFFFWRSRVITIPMSFFVLQSRTFAHKLHIIEKTAVGQNHQDEHVLETNWDSLVMYNYDKLKSLSIPVHLLHGQHDLLVAPAQSEKLSQILPNVTVDIIPHAGHLPPVETPETLARIMEKYLK